MKVTTFHQVPRLRMRSLPPLHLYVFIALCVGIGSSKLSIYVYQSHFFWHDVAIPFTQKLSRRIKRNRYSEICSAICLLLKVPHLRGFKSHCCWRRNRSLYTGQLMSRFRIGSYKQSSLDRLMSTLSTNQFS